ncbi:trk system potassium uptake protein TrkA [Kineococcus xinjiangensis]|uniref:Trk system potassium uptake protein TrkA n=1 Tax=Kineococcus xinjiangensis TaxID=512762 RepID=A0A2S6IUX8_9ACTN|nr:TrkA family potassium uptake protein [Kineococcus xinjiangensis]PPK98082.1 trk system potassium uptake protein TrkA [Kineococcus xinjiangensis]
MKKLTVRQPNRSVAVIGLGRFGRSLALELASSGDVDVLGIDSDRGLVDELSTTLTHAVVADSTREDALRQLSVHEFDRAVVGIGSNLEASILTASLLVQFGIPHIWAKAISEPHARILAQIGVQHVTRPEYDMGLRIAHLVRGRMQDFIEFEEGFAMVKTVAPPGLVGRTLHEARVRADHRVTVVAHHRPGEPFTYATPDTLLQPGDVVIVSGATRDVERFSDLA